MGKAILFCMMVLSGFSAQALGRIRFVELGLKAGINTRYSNTEQTVDGYQVGIYPKMGLHAGIMGRVSLPFFHIQPEILYTTSACQLDVIGGGTAAHAKMRINTWDFPILLGKRILDIFRIEIGPVFDLATANSISLQSGSAPVQVITSRAAMNYMCGVGVDLYEHRLNFDLRYNGSLKRPEQSIIVNGAPAFPVKTRMGNWMISAGYMF